MAYINVKKDDIYFTLKNADPKNVHGCVFWGACLF